MEEHEKGTNWSNEEAKQLGVELEKLRTEQNMTPEEVANAAGLSVRTILAIEQGRYNTGVRQLTSILQALGYEMKFVKK